MKKNNNLFVDKRGCLIPIEFNNIGFIPKRVFVVNNVPVGMVRGNHSHHKTKQLLICINGLINVFLDNGKEKTQTLLGVGESITIPEMVWDSQEFLEKNSEILVICSTEYDLNDYILDYTEFLKLTQ